ncbi:MAG: hypothetical protein ACXADB_00065 [Candidatus Hermodarchaeia archaeon]|jgi:hypothetical protein
MTDPDKKEEKKDEKKAEKKPEPIILKKRPYTVRLEVQAPVELTYRVWAETPEQAVEMIRYGQMVAPPKPNLAKRRNIKATVYKYGTVMIEFIKKYV